MCVNIAFVYTYLQTFMLGLINWFDSTN